MAINSINGAINSKINSDNDYIADPFNYAIDTNKRTFTHCHYGNAIYSS